MTTSNKYELLEGIHSQAARATARTVAMLSVAVAKGSGMTAKRASALQPQKHCSYCAKCCSDVLLMLQL